MKKIGNYVYSIIILITIISCREDAIVDYQQKYTLPYTESGGYKGMYVLCEGAMGRNMCTLDYLDLSDNDKINYFRNIYGARNPNVVKELGDVGNDIQIYGSRLWIVVNCSNKVEVCNADNSKRIGQINIPNCRYIVFDGKYAYISSYVGPVNDGTQLGRVYKVDTLTLEKTDSITVGYQPEEMAIVNKKLYVANSGGYRMPSFDTTVSVIDLINFKKEDDIDVAPNLHRMRADKYGKLWVSSRGNYEEIQSKLYCLSLNDQGKMCVVDVIDIPVSEICIVGDTLYVQGTTMNFNSNESSTTYNLINVKSKELLHTNLFDSQEISNMTLPYGMIVNPQKKDFYLFDAKDFVSSGELLHFKSNGNFDWKQSTGDIPSRAVFIK